MKMMDNQQTIQAIEKTALHAYLKTLIDAELSKITLFTIFPQTGAPNWSEAKELVMIKNPALLGKANGGKFLN